MSEDQKVSQYLKNNQDQQNNSLKSENDPTQERKSFFRGRIIFLKRITSVLIILIILIVLSLSYFRTKYPEDFSELANRFHIGVSSYNIHQMKNIISGDTKSEDGVMMDFAIDKIYKSSGFKVESRTVSIYDNGRMADIVTEGDILPSAYDAHYTINILEGRDIYNEELIVEKVNEETPAQQAGIKEKDQIISVDDLKLNNRDELSSYIQPKNNIPVSLKIRRGDDIIAPSLIPQKMNGEKVILGVQLAKKENQERSRMEVIIKNGISYDNYAYGYMESTADVDDMDRPSLSGDLQWCDLQHYINYLRFYENPKIIKNTDLETTISFDVDLDYFSPVDMNKYGDNGDVQMFDRILKITGELTIDKDSQNPIQEKLKIYMDGHSYTSPYKKTIDVTMDFRNFNKGAAINLPDSKDIIRPAYKPVIYLYPQKSQNVKVSLDFDGEFTATYPKYNNGWSVFAHPEGKLVDLADGKEYSYLFWEGIYNEYIDYDWSEGFVVRGGDTVEFLQGTLSDMGLTPEEYNEFIVYWMPKMQNNKYNLIHFADKAEYDDHTELTVEPQPDSVLRVFMVYKPLEEWIAVEPQEVEPFERKGFTVVEWGGAEIK